MKTKQIMTILCTLAIIFQSTLFSQDAAERKIVFEVPLELYDIHEDAAKVCLTVKVYQGEEQIALGYVEIPTPENGNLTESITVEAHESEGKDISQATRYTVLLELMDARGVAGPPIQCPYDPTHDLKFCAKEDAPFVKHVSGNL